MNCNQIDKEIIRLLQGDLPLVSRPYAPLAQKLGITEEEIVQRISELIKNGQIRRMAAVLRHRSAGYRSNAMVAWKADPGQIDQIGEFMASCKQISHCYHRGVSEEFNYPLFTMIHAHNDEELMDFISQLSKLTGIQEYKIVKSARELKKVSMKYF